MPRPRPILTVAAAALTLGAAIPALAGAATSPTPAVHALFVETDQPAGNQILSFLRGSDGTLAKVGTTSTGGHGAIAAGATADPLASQGGLALVDGGRELLAVNAGSNTISVLAVSGTSLTLVQKISSHGVFPVSLAAHGATVAVLDAADTGTVATYRLSGGRLVDVAGSVRRLGLTEANPPNFLASPGQVGFSPDGKHLIVTDKASTSNFQVFGVSAAGLLSTTAVVSAAQNPVPFAFTFDPAGHLVAVEAKTSSLSTYTLASSGALTPIGTVSDNAKALCWLAEVGGHFYGANAGSGTVSSFTVAADGTPALDQAVAASTQPGTTDFAQSPDGHFLYVESGGVGAVNGFKVAADGTLVPVTTVWTIPVASEGLAAS